MNQILFIQTAFVGDLLLSIPTLRALKSEHPDARITLLCRKGLGDFMRSASLIDEVVEADKSSPESWAAVESKLTNVSWSLIYCPHQSPRSLLLARKLRAPRKVGYRSLLGKFVFNEAVERPMHLPEALRQLVLLPSKRTAEVMDFEPQENQNIYRRLPKLENKKSVVRSEKFKAVPAWASMEVPALKSSKRKAVVISPGSVWATKKWTEEGFVEATRYFLSQGKTVYLLGSADEKEICERVRTKAMAGSMAPADKVANLAGAKTLWESAQVMASAELVVTNDSGAMHMAACAGTPSVSIFGPTVLEQGYRPWQTKARVIHAVLSCRPCGKHGSQKCPIGTHECMKLVPSESVANAAQELI
jgi:heptosyltransferase II